MSFSKKPLGDVMEIIEKSGFEITYVYDDLIFVNNLAFIIKFGENNDEIEIFYNADCFLPEADQLKTRLHKAFSEKSFKIYQNGKFSLKQKVNEEIEINFLDAV
jgi:hypothetical protein